MLTRPVAVLIRNQVLLTSPPQETVRAACQRMRDRYVGSVVVTDERGHLVGIFTERDAVCRVLAEGRDADRTTLAKVMTTEVATVSPQATALEALRLMQDGGFRHVPVVAEDGWWASSPTPTSAGRSTRAWSTRRSCSRRSAEGAADAHQSRNARRAELRSGAQK